MWMVTSEVEHAVCNVIAGPVRPRLCETLVAMKSRSTPII